MGRLRDRMAEDLRLRNFSPATRRNYLIYARKFVAFFMRSPEELGEAEIRQFLLHQLEVKRLSYSTYRQIYAALKFLYTVTLQRPWEVDPIPFPRQREWPLPVILSPDELAVLFQTFRRLKYRALFMSCYGAGLRINEACHLRVTDVDSKQMLIHVRHPKGGQERLTLLSAKLLEVLRAYWREHKSRLWLFPGTTPGQPVSREAARAALAKASLEAGLTKKCKPHTLRHCFATHLLDAGVELVVLQALLGHRSIRTTSCYTHVSVPHLQKVVSPLDRLPTISPTAPAQRKVQG
jgi:integrase/recombinase XerD